MRGGGRVARLAASAGPTGGPERLRVLKVGIPSGVLVKGGNVPVTPHGKVVAPANKARLRYLDKRTGRRT
jgi:hypothetical protein